MGKLVTIATKARFDALREASNISETSLNFILETGLLYTHNIFINGASFGTEASNYIPVKIGGVTKNLSLNGHTHSNYYDNSSDIDIGSNKIKSGTLELLKYSSDTLILGNSSIPTEFFGTLKTTKDGTKYTILDTNNFSIVNKTSTNLTLNNVALFKYGSSSFLLDYVRRYNTVETFNNLAKYTSAGTTNENSKAYGFITLSTDTGTNTYSYAQIRVNIPDNTLEFRTSSDTTWKGTLLGGTYRNITINGDTYSIVTKAGSLPSIIAPTALGTSGQYLTTSDDGKSLAWRTLPTDNNTWRPIAVNGTEKRTSATSSGNLDIINGTNTTVEWTSGNKLKINAVDTWTAFVGASDSVAGTAGYVSAPGKGNQGKFFRGDGTWATPTNTWNAANTSQAGYIPKLETGGGTISTQASEYVLTYVSSGSGTVTPTWKLLPANAFKNDNTWKAANSSQEGYVPKSTASKILRSDANGALYWGDDSNTWKEVTTSLEGYVPKIVTTGSLAATDSPFILVFKNVSGSTKTAWVPLPANAFKNDNTWTPWAGATASANGTAGYMPAPTSAQRGQFLRGDGSWVSLNNYSLPTASSSTLGGVKTGAAITDTTGYTAVAIKDGVIYYKDTNNTYSFSNLLFLLTSGTNLMTYNSQAVRTVLAGSNITFTHSNNVLTITAKDTTYSTVSKSAAGLCPALPNETTTTKYLRLDGSWVTPPNDNTWRGVYVGGASKVGTGTNTLPINFVAGSNVSITYEAAGTGSGQSGNAGYFNVKIAATDTTYSDFVKSGSTAAHGLVPKPPTTAGTTKYLREDGTWQTPPNDNTWKPANTSLEGYVPKSTANKILRANGDGALYWGDDANTTYTFYNLQFQNSGGTTVDTYKPTTSPTKTLKAGSNVTISAASNVITIASTNTWNANAVGVAGYVAAPTKAANANMVWKTDSDGNPAWRADANDNTLYYLTLNGTVNGTSGKTNLGTFYAVATSDATAKDLVWMRKSDNTGYAWRALGSRAFDSTSYLPLSGGSLDNGAYISWSGATVSSLITNSTYMGICMGVILSCGPLRISADTDASTTTENVIITAGYKMTDATAANGLSVGKESLKWKGTEVSLNGHKHAYTDLTGSSTIANQAILSNGTTNGWKLATVSLDGHNHNASYVTSVGVTDDNTNHANQLRYVLNGTSNYFTVPYSTTSGTSEATYLLHARSSALESAGVQFIQGQIKTGSSNNQAYSGSSSNFKVLSFPPNATAINSPGTANESANVAIFRIAWGTTYWHDLHFSPNNDNIYHRGVFNSSPIDWRIVVETTGNKGNSTKPVYVSGGLIYECDAYPTKASWNYDDKYVTAVGAGTGSYNNQLYYTKNGSNTYFTVPYASNADKLDGWHNTKFCKVYTRAEIGETPNFDNLKDVDGNQVNGFFESRVAETTGATGKKPPITSCVPMLSFLNLYVSLQLVGISGGSWYIRGAQGGNVANSNASTNWDRLVTNSGTWNIDITGTAGSVAWSNVTGRPNCLPLAGGTMVGTIDASSDSWGGGGFHSGYANIILRGNTTTGTSGIVFSSSKENEVINRPSDCAFILFLPYGVSAATAVGTNPTINTSGETGRFVIGIHNDSDDLLWLLTSASSGLKHVVGTNVYTIYDSNNLPAYPTKSSWNYDDVYVKSVSISGNNLRINKNGSNSDLTIPYASSAGEVAWNNITSKPCILVSYGRNSENINANTWKAKECSFIERRHTELTYSNFATTSGYQSFLNLWTPDGLVCTQFQIADGAFYYRSKQSGTAEITTNWYRVMDSNNCSVSKDGETLTVKINGTEKSLTNTNTWRSITDSYNVSSPSSSISLSQVGAKALYDALLNGYASTAGTADGAYLLKSRSNITSGGVQYITGQIAFGTSANTAYWGSSNNFNLMSVPVGGTSNNGGTIANVGILRIDWGTSYWHDLHFSPNDTRVFHRSVLAGTASNWEFFPSRVFDGTNTSLGGASTPIYIDSNGHFAQCNTFLTSHQTVSGTFWGNSWSNGGSVSGTITISGNWENDFGIRLNEGGSALYGFDVLYGAGDLFKIATRNNSTTGTNVITIARGSTNVTVVGNAYATNFYTTSDRSKKQNISSFSEHIRKFQLKDTEKWHYGVIAQEVEEMFRDGEEGNMTVNYNSVLSYYVGLLENKVKLLEEKIKKLENNNLKQ